MAQYASRSVCLVSPTRVTPCATLTCLVSTLCFPVRPDLACLALPAGMAQCATLICLVWHAWSPRLSRLDSPVNSVILALLTCSIENDFWSLGSSWDTCWCLSICFLLLGFTIVFSLSAVNDHSLCL